MNVHAEQNNLPSLGFKLLAGSMLLLAASFLGVLGDLPHLPLMVAAGLLPALWRKRPLPVSDRSVTYTILMAIVVATTLGYFFPLERGHLGLFSYFFRPEYYAAYALNLAVVSCYFPSRDLIAGTTLGATIFVLGSCGDADPFSLDNTRFVWGSRWVIAHSSHVYTAVIAGELLLGLWLLQATRPVVRTTPALRRWRLLPLYTVSCLVGCLWGTFVLHHLYERNIRNLERSFISAGGRSLWQGRTRSVPMFTDEVDLNLPFPLGGEKNERQIVLRAVAEAAPGYLRARAFSRYEQGRWLAEKESPPLLLEHATASGLLALSRFQRTDRPPVTAAARRCDLFFAGNLRSEKLLVPAPFVRVDLIADGLTANQEGELSPVHWKRDGGYIVYTPSQNHSETAFDLPMDAEALGAGYVQVPDALQAGLAAVSAAIPGLATAISDRERLGRLQHHFATHYRYRLGVVAAEGEAMTPVKIPSGSFHSCALTEVSRDPVLTFLVETRAGHCELFAAAAVLLLRQMGVPARYVTGFLCYERHPSGSYYLSRIGHAHAWVEVYDREQRAWTLFDPTPASDRSDYADEWNVFSSVGDRLKHNFWQFLASIQRGQIAESWLIILRFLWSLIGNPPGLTLLTLAGCGWGWRLWRRRKRELVVLTAAQRQAVASYQRLSRHWQKRLRLAPSASRTARELLQLAAQSSAVTAQELAELSRSVSGYEQDRFGVQVGAEESPRGKAVE